MPRHGKRSGGTSSSGRDAARRSTATTYEETLTILDDDESARDEARAYRKQSIDLDTLLTDEDVAQLGWDLPTAATFRKAAKALRSASNAPHTPTYTKELFFGKAISNFLRITGLYDVASKYATQTSDHNLAAADLLDEMARSWKIAADRDLSGAGPQPGWALRRARPHGKTVVAFPLCTLRHTGTSGGGSIDVLIGKTVWNGPDPPDYAIVIVRLETFLRPATFSVVHPAPKAPHASSPSRKHFEPPDEVKRLLAKNGLLGADERATLQDALFDKSLRNDLNLAAKELADPATDAAQRAMWQEVIFQALEIAARLEDTSISPADRTLFSHILDGKPLPSRSELQDNMGYTATEALKLEDSWQQLSTSVLTRIAGARGSYSLPDLHRLVRGRPISRAIALVCLYARIGSKETLQSLLEGTLTFLCNHAAAQSVASWTACHARAIAADNPNGGPCLAISDRLRGNAYILADHDPASAASYLNTLIHAHLAKAADTKTQTAYAICQALAQPDDEPPVGIDREALKNALRTAFDHAGIVNRIIDLIPKRSAVWFLAQTVHMGGAAWRHLAETTLVTPTPTGTTRIEQLEAACARLHDPVTSAAKDAVSTGTVPDELAAAAALAELAGAAPAWLNEAATLIDQAQPADQPADRALRAFYPIWRRHNPQEGLGDFANEAIQKSRPAFAASQLNDAPDAEAMAPYQRVLTNVVALRAAVGNLIAGNDETAGGALLEAIGNMFAPKEADDGDHVLSTTFDREVMRLVATCFEHDPDILRPQPDVDPAPLTALYHHVWSMLGEQAATHDVTSYKGPFPLEVLCAAGARAAETRSEAALIGLFARREYRLSKATVALINRSAFIGEQIDLDVFLPAVAYQAGSTKVFFRKLRNIANRLDTIGFDDREAPASASPPDGAAGTAAHGVEGTQGQLEDALIDFMRDPRLGEGADKGNLAHTLHRLLVKRHKHRAASVIIYAYVSPHQLNSLARDLRWTYRLNPRLDPDELARELAARAAFLTEYLLGPFARAVTLSQSKVGDDYGMHGLAEFSGAVFEAVTALVDLGLLQRGYNQEHALPRLVSALERAARAVGSRPELDASRLADAAQMLRSAVSRIFPEQLPLPRTITDAPASSLVNAAAHLLLNRIEHADGLADVRTNDALQTVLDELDRRRKQPATAGEPAYLPEAYAWLDEIAHEQDGGMTDAVRAVSTCALHLIQAGAQQGTQRSLANLDHELVALAHDEQMPAAAAGRCLLRFWHTFHVAASWCHTRLQDLIDALAPGITTDILAGIADVEEAAAEEAPSPANRASRLESAAVAAALAAPDVEHVSDSYAKAAAIAYTEVSTLQHALAAPLLSALIFRHTGPFIDAVARLNEHHAQEVGALLGIVATMRPWYLAHASLKAAYAAYDAGDEVPPALHRFATMLMVRDDAADGHTTESVADLMDDVCALTSEGRAAIAPIIMVRQGGGGELTDMLTSVLAAVQDERLDEFLVRILYITLPSTNLIDAAQQLLFRNLPDAAQRVARALNAAGRAYLTLVRALVRTEPVLDDDAEHAVRVLAATGVAQLPAVFRDAATTLLYDAQDAHPRPLRARFSATGSFLGFAGDRQDASVLGTLAARVRTHARDVIEALERAADQAERSTDADDQGADQANAARKDARRRRRLNEQASTLRDLMRAHAAISALSVADGHATLHLTIALEFVACAADPDPAVGMGARATRATRERLSALAACLQQPQAFLEAERAIAQLDEEHFSAIEDVIDLLTPQDNVTPVNDEGAARLRTVQRLRTPLARGLARITQTVATQARELLAFALEHTAPATAHDLDRICHDLAFVASRLAEADITPRSTGDLAEVRYLGEASDGAGGTGRLALWCAAATLVRSENAYAGFSVLRDIIASYPPGTFLDELSQTVEQLRNESASRIDVRIENRELDGTVALLVRNDSDRVDAALDVVSLELRPEAGSDEGPQYHNLIGSTHLDLPAGGSGTTWTPLALPFPDEPPAGPARIVCHLRSGAGNAWEVATREALARPAAPRELAPRKRYREDAKLLVKDLPFYGRERELSTLRNWLVDRSDRANGIKVVGAKGVGKTALVSHLMGGQFTLGNEQDGCSIVFAGTTCDLGHDPATLLYDEMVALDKALTSREDGADAAQLVRTQAETLRAAIEQCPMIPLEPRTQPSPGPLQMWGFLRQREWGGALAKLEESGFAATLVVDEAQLLLKADPRELDALRVIAAATDGVLSWLFVGTGELVDLDTGTSPAPALFANAPTVRIGHFPSDPQGSDMLQHMLNDPSVLGEGPTALRFTDEAVAYLAEYTAGHARAALKIANATVSAATDPSPHTSFASPLKRFIYAVDIHNALTGGGTQERDKTAFGSIHADFKEIKLAPGVETTLLATQKLAIDDNDAWSSWSLDELITAARQLDEQLNAAPSTTGAAIRNGLSTLISRDFMITEINGRGIERYRFTSPLYAQFARCGYRLAAQTRLADMKHRGAVAPETRAAEHELVEQGFKQLYLDAKEELEHKNRQLEMALERPVSSNQTTYNIEAQEGSSIQAPNVSGVLNNITVGDITINYTVGQLNQIEQVLLSAGRGDTQAPTDARSIAAHLPWPTDHQFRRAGTERLAAARSQEAGECDAVAARPNATDEEQDLNALERLELQSLADEAYATQFAEASTAMMGKSAEDLRSWLNEDVNRATLAKVGVTWNGTGGNPLFDHALTSGDSDLVGTCRNVCVTAMIFSLLQLANFGNFSPVATLLAQETEHLWKHRLMKAVLQNDTARLMLVNWNERGGFTSHHDSLPVGIWAQNLQDGGSNIIGRSELGRFWQLGAHGKPAGADNPWNGTFPKSLGTGKSYQLEPAYAPVSVDLLVNVAPSHVDELLERYEPLSFDCAAGSVLKVNNLDVLVHALGSAHDTPAERQERYRELARYFAGIACIRSLRNHASHGAADERRSPFDERSARMLFEVTASDALDGQPELPAITFAAKRGTNAFWSVVESTSATDWAFAVTPAGGGVLLETAKLADKLEDKHL